jgi:hypothetical protein
VWADASVLLKNGIHAGVIEQVFNKWCQSALMYGGEFMVSGTKNEKRNKRKKTQPIAHHTTQTAYNVTS